MTEELYNEMVDYYGDRLVDADVFPSTFEYQVKLFIYWKTHDANSR